MKRILLLVLLLSVPACHAPVSYTTPQGKAAYVANNVVTALGDFRDGVFAAVDAQWLSVHVGSIVNRSVQAALDAIDQAPNGAYATAAGAFTGIQSQLSAEEYAKAKPYLDAARAVVEAIR